MKRIITTVAAILAAITSIQAMNDDGHQLTKLWEKYEQAHKADKPKTEAEILQQIKEEAKEKRLPVDFYDAATQYVNAVERRNWKEREPARKALEKEVADFAEPIVTFVWMDQYMNYGADRLKAFVDKNSFIGHNPAFYRKLGAFLGGTLANFIKDDEEYVLWRVLACGTMYQRKSCAEAVETKIGDDYPQRPALEYYMLPSEDSTMRRALNELAARYDGTAAGLFPKADLLSLRFKDLEKKTPKTDAPYRKLMEDVTALEKERKAFKGDEAVIAKSVTAAESIGKTLNSKSVDVSTDSSRVTVILRNLESVKLSMMQDGSSMVLQSWDLKNTRGSFYLKDTVRIAIPAVADGDYTFDAVNGKNSATAYYQQYRLSIATRRDSRGQIVYVADYKSGKPLTKAKIYLKKGSSVVASTTLSLDGFTPLPSSLTRKISSKSSYSIYAENGKRRSKTVWLDTSEDYDGYDSDAVKCNIYRDRGAYNPGDVLKYKAVLYSGNPMRELKVLEGRKLTVTLYDSEDNKLESTKLTTNAYGSVSGEFKLPEGLRNGRFRMSITEGNSYLGSDYFRVDEFVLPNFEIFLDGIEDLYVRGDDVPVSGSVRSYSGHSLSGARAELRATFWGDKVFEDTIELGADNKFFFKVPTARSGYYGYTVKITDSTGETQEKKGGFYIGDELSIDMDLLNAAEGEFTLMNEESVPLWRRWNRVSRGLVTDGVAKVKLQAKDDNGNSIPLPVNWEIDGVASGTAASGDIVEIPLKSGLYVLKTSVQERGLKGEAKMNILAIGPSDKTLPKGVKRVWLPGEDKVKDKINVCLGSGNGTAYAVVSLFGESRSVLLDRKVVYADDAVGRLSLDYRDSYPDAVRLQVFYFLDGEAVSYQQQYRREKTKFSLPLTFTRFTDAAYPGTEYTFELKTAEGVEALAAVWDKSIDAIARNRWSVVSMAEYSVASVPVSSTCGKIAGGGDYDDIIMYKGATKSGGLLMRSAAPMQMNAMVDDGVAMEELADAASVEEEAASADELDVTVRENFEAALTFQPHLESAKDGSLKFSFKTSDKLSTYYVRVYAHTPAMQNALVEKEMVVSLPVKVSLLEPQFLYEGDRYEAAVTVSCISDAPVSGRIRLDVLMPDGSVRRLSSAEGLSIAPGETRTERFTVEVPALNSVILSAGEESLSLTASFISDDFSDAVRITVPVLPARQTLTEAHSAVLLAGADREALLKDLRGRFVNVPGADATLREITVLDMVMDAIPSHVEPSGKDILSLSEAWYTQHIANILSDTLSAKTSADELLNQILACRNSDGGYAWFEGMNSSPVMTAVILERFALLKARGVEVPDTESSVKFLDKTQFDTQKPLWYGWLSDAQYMHVRAMYPEVPFEVNATTTAAKKRMTEFKKYAKDYLTPSKKAGRGLQGQILAKARRLLTLRHLSASSEGVALAKAWGVGVSAGTKMAKSIKADVVSLLEYAVEHRDGGWYYPNAVMPWRGLLESEAYAHALLSNLLSDDSAEVSDGIRLWLMLQKETQKWDADPAFVDAIDAILKGSKAVLDTRVLALSATYDAPFEDIKAAGNGFTVDRRFYRQGSSYGELSEIQPGDEVRVGDKIIVKYNIWNGENRSFVRMTAGREASLRPVQQLSGLQGWRCYRNVKAVETQYYWESYPEETSAVTEEFYVTQAGRFTAPVTVIESLYAPHYRANSAFRIPLNSQP